MPTVNSIDEIYHKRGFFTLFRPSRAVATGYGAEINSLKNPKSYGLIPANFEAKI